VERRRAALVLDSGALVALSRGDVRVRGILDEALRRTHEVAVPMVTIAETHRGAGPREALLNRTLGRLEPSRPLDEPTARLAGVLLGEANSSSTIDALVMAEALTLAPSVVVTSDPTDLRLLLGERRGVEIRVC
jgi:predicted nucleic acid-binding protein